MTDAEFEEVQRQRMARIRAQLEATENATQPVSTAPAEPISLLATIASLKQNQVETLLQNRRKLERADWDNLPQWARLHGGDADPNCEICRFFQERTKPGQPPAQPVEMRDTPLSNILSDTPPEEKKATVPQPIFTERMLMLNGWATPEKIVPMLNPAYGGIPVRVSDFVPREYAYLQRDSQGRPDQIVVGRGAVSAGLTALQHLDETDGSASEIEGIMANQMLRLIEEYERRNIMDLVQQEDAAMLNLPDPAPAQTSAPVALIPQPSNTNAWKPGPISTNTPAPGIIPAVPAALSITVPSPAGIGLVNIAIGINDLLDPYIGRIFPPGMQDIVKKALNDILVAGLNATTPSAASGVYGKSASATAIQQGNDLIAYLIEVLDSIDYESSDPRFKEVLTWKETHS